MSRFFAGAIRPGAAAEPSPSLAARGGIVGLALVLAAVSACRGPAAQDGTASATADSTPRVAAPVDEAPVVQDINANFLDPNLDVDSFVERFELESREIARYRHRIADALGLQPGMAVADIGAGTGMFEPIFAKRVGSDGLVYAVDISPGFVEAMTARFLADGLHNVIPVLCTEKSCELRPDSVDRVFVCDTYHHFTYPATTLASIRRAMRPGAELLIVDFERIEGVSSDWILSHVRAGKAVVREEIEAAGFRFVEEVEIDGLEENYCLRFARGD